MTVFSGLRIDASRRAACLLLAGAKMLATTFRSPVAVPALTGFHSRVNVPGQPLRFPASRFYSPFDPSLRHRTRFASRGSAASTLGARCRFRDLHVLPLSGLRSPSGPLRPSGSKHLPDLLQIDPPSESARFPFAPRGPDLERVRTTDQRSRIATFPEACCSSNLLEPSSLCPRSRNWSTIFVIDSSSFPQLLFT
jgi:hypothetical protein